MKGIILTAGYGTRFLPITKTLPKEMLPLGTRPALDYVVQEFIDSGLTDILIINSRRKTILEDYSDREREWDRHDHRRRRLAHRREFHGTGTGRTDHFDRRAGDRDERHWPVCRRDRLVHDPQDVRAGDWSDKWDVRGDAAIGREVGPTSRQEAAAASTPAPPNLRRQRGASGSLRA